MMTMSNIQYLKIDDSNFTKLLNLFIQDNAVAYEYGDTVCFGIRDDLARMDEYKLLNTNLILLTSDLSCNVMVENNIVTMMTIYRP